MRNPKTKHLGLDWLIFPVYVLSHLSHKKLSHSFLSKKTLPSLPSKKKTLPSLCSSSIIFPLTIPVPHSRKPNLKKTTYKKFNIEAYKYQMAHVYEQIREGGGK